MDYSSFHCLPTDCSLPPADSMNYTDYFDNPYLVEPYNAELDYALGSFLDRGLYSTEHSREIPPATLNNSVLPISTSPNANCCVYRAAPSPQSTSPTSSVYNNTLASSSLPTQDSYSPPTSPPAFSCSPEYPKRRSSCSSPSSPVHETLPCPVTRKRGRPRLHRANSNSSTCSENCIHTHKHRVPHNEVERKYRDRLNTELERLRRVVPTLPRGHTRLSKSMILAGAIDYIEKTEREKEAARHSQENSRGRQPPAKRRSSGNQQ